MNPAALATLENCRYCLMCRHADPLGHITRREALTPRGIALTAVSQQRGVIEWSEESIGVIFRETDAGVARAHCVTDQPFSEAISLVRADLVTAGLAPPAVYAFDETLQRRSSGFGPTPSAGPPARGRTALLVGDEGHHLAPEAVDAARRLLDAAGHASVSIGSGRDIGFFPASLGLLDTARRLARALRDEVEQTGAERVVVLGPGDLYTLTRLYPERLGVAWPEGVEVIELTTLLAEHQSRTPLPFAPLDDATPWAYVDPTHAVRVPDRHDAPRTLLGTVLTAPAVELFWRRERAHPVGSTALQFTHPELAATLTTARLDDAATRGARLLVTDDPGTLGQLRRHADAHGLRIAGLYELLAARLAA